jgi:hypothetical protein
MRSPDPAVFPGVAPFAVPIEILSSPNVLVEVFRVGAESLREVAFAFADPLVECVRRSGGEQIPIAGVRARDDEFRRAPVAQRES